MSREQAIRVAATQAPKGWVVVDSDASILRTWRERPFGYPVWQVDQLCEEDVPGPDRAMQGREVLVDGVTGEVAWPPPRSEITENEAIEVAAFGVRRQLYDDGWTVTDVMVSERDTTGKWGPTGRPIWEVRVECSQYSGAEVSARRIETRLVDGITGEVVRRR